MQPALTLQGSLQSHHRTSVHNHFLENMKKTYISPAIEAVDIKGITMAAASVGTDLEGVTPSGDKPTELKIRGFRTVSFFDDEEEEEMN